MKNTIEYIKNHNLNNLILNNNIKPDIEDFIITTTHKNI